MKTHYQQMLTERVTKTEWVGNDLIITFAPKTYLHAGLFNALCDRYELPESKILYFKSSRFMNYIQWVRISNLKGGASGTAI